jgi:hypothetical protein
MVKPAEANRRPPEQPKPSEQPTKNNDELTKKMVRWTRIVGVFTGFLFLTSAIADGFIYWQGSIAHDAQIDTRDQLRAVVTAAGGNIFTDVGPDGKAVDYRFASNFHNYGATRTNTFHGWLSIHYFEGTVPNSQDFTKPWDKIDIPNSIIPAGATIAVGPVSIAAADAIKAKNKEGSVIAWGHVDWTDIFKREEVHPIDFCLLFQPASSEGDNKIVFQPAPFRADCNSGQ